MRLLVDDLRDFLDPAPAHVARTSLAGLGLLRRYRHERIDELWLDHDLGGDDTIWPVVEELERAAFDGAPFDVGTVYVHSANPPGAAKILQALRRWNYHAVAATHSAAVGYRDV
ncbi:cyclic-phosphate processing receiver domain-containing protein [Dactylosporangium sp. NPDC000244]|uniref:cyclic-phosphate processing receiver domain-containing protein n=1 Tax=Dactylosporangium sp. NPDC000244 TaxID=3154365 RepID=UPI003334A486